MRTQHSFALPAAISTGIYRVNVVVSQADQPETGVTVPLSELKLTERPHKFDLPQTGVAVNGMWQEGVRLARVAIPTDAQPGTSLPITLVWQAGGATARSWKVFVHLVDQTGAIRAQGDAYPVNEGDGSSPTSTWREGEVIIDTHVVILPPDLPTDAYAVQIGLYDEATNDRLPLLVGGDTFTLPVLLHLQAP